jgi:glyoxylase I family protein
MANTNKTIGGGGFHHLALRVRDYDKSVDFYTAVLGCTPKVVWGEKPARGALLDTGDGNYMELFERPNQAPVTEEGTMLHVAFRTSDTNAATERVRKAGYPITVEPKNHLIEGRPYAVPIRISFFTGPDGEVIEFFQNELT